MMRSLILAIIAVSILSLLCGAAGFGMALPMAALHGGDAARAILLEIRLPRLALAILAGIALGGSGAGLQAYSRNGLADAGLLGIGGCAGLAAVLVFYGGFLPSSPVWVASAAGFGAALGALTLAMLSGRNAPPMRLLLAGIALGAMSSALTTLVLSLMPSPFAIYEAMSWLFGSLDGKTMGQVWASLPPIIVGMGILWQMRKGLDALALGSDVAATFGFPAEKLQRGMIISTSLLVGATVAACGSIGFVGLVAPHLCRPFVGGQPSRLIIPSGLVGAILLVLADMLVRVIPTVSQTEIRLGVITALIGAPFLFILARREARG